MSNPLNNLRKSRKIPLPHSSLGTNSRNIPYRNAGYTMDESKLLDEITSNLAADRLRDIHREPSLPRIRDSGQGGSTSTSPRSNGVSTDQELMSLMMSRLAQLEQKLQYHMKESNQKDKKIRILEDKIRILQKARESSDPGRLQELEKKCLLLQQQTHEMETFLADYGMIWVGESLRSTDNNYEDLSVMGEEDSSDEAEEDNILTRGDVNALWTPGTSVAKEFDVDFDIVIRNIEELNALAGEGIGQIQHRSDGARLKMPESVQLTLYANGIMMFSGPFRPYTDKLTQICMQDFMDGYFPSELQDRYPDGIPFHLTDKRELHFKDRLSQVFEGHGQLLGGETVPSRLVPSNLDKNKSKQSQTDGSTRQETSQLPGPQLSMEQFLQRLPSSVIKEGKIIDVRNDVGNALNGSHGPNGVTVVETAAVKDIKHTLEERKSASTRDLTTLRVKNERGDHTYILKMKYTDTIADLKSYLNKQRPRSAGPFDIVSTFPKKMYDELTFTLKEYDLVPNATLHLQPKKHK